MDDGKRRRVDSAVGLRSHFDCKPGRSTLDSSCMIRYVDVLSISSEHSLRELPPLPAVGILARDDNLETGRETEKKGGTICSSCECKPSSIGPLLTRRIIRVASTRDENPRRLIWKAGGFTITKVMSALLFLKYKMRWARSSDEFSGSLAPAKLDLTQVLAWKPLRRGVRL